MAITDGMHEDVHKWWKRTISEILYESGNSISAFSDSIGVGSTNVSAWKTRGSIPKDAEDIGARLERVTGKAGLKDALVEACRLNLEERSALISRQNGKTNAAASKYMRRG